MPLLENTPQPTNTEKNIAIELSGVVHAYDKKVDSSSALHFNQWSVEAGQQVFLHGDSGSGKSTLLNLLCGILSPQEGCVRLLGTDITKLSNSARDRFRAENVGVVFQQFNLIPYLSVAKNIELAIYLAKSSKLDLNKNIEHFMSVLKLPSTILDSPVSSLSVGQQQRVAIMRAFINSPKLLLIDEPTSALDSAAKTSFMTHLLEMCHTHKTTMVFVSHDSSLESFFSIHTPISSFCHTGLNEDVG